MAMQLRFFSGSAGGSRWLRRGLRTSTVFSSIISQNKTGNNREHSQPGEVPSCLRSAGVPANWLCFQRPYALHWHIFFVVVSRSLTGRQIG